MPATSRKPVRNVVPVSRTGYRGEHPMSRCGGKLVQCELMLELDALAHLDAFDREIVDVAGQPFPIKYRFGGRSRTWTPDFLVERRGVRPELVEVKPLKRVYPDDKVEQAAMHRQIDAMEEASAREGFDFRLLTEQEIRVQPALYNAKLMSRHAPVRHEAALVLRGRAAILGSVGGSVPELQSRLGDGVDAFPIAIALDWLGHLELDRGTRFSARSTFRIL